MFEELGNDYFFKCFWVFYNECCSVFAPRCYIFIAGIDHMIGFSQKDWDLCRFVSIDLYFKCFVEWSLGCHLLYIVLGCYWFVLVCVPLLE